jgi:predicted RND superfamily exporter protein
MASVSFTIKHIPLQQVHDRLGLMRQDAQPPDGVRIAPVGSLALGSSTVDAVVGTRLLMNILCLGVVFAVLLLVYRRLPRALFIILPVGLVIGWASLAMYVGGLALNPLTAVLGLIVVGIGTEFMVLLTSRYEEEKQKGEPPRRAMVIASSRMGRAIVTTGLTTLAGFGVLVASNFVMIRDFGVVTIIGVFLCLVSTIVVMPPLMVWFDERSSRKRLSKRRTPNTQG